MSIQFNIECIGKFVDLVHDICVLMKNMHTHTSLQEFHEEYCVFVRRPQKSQTQQICMSPKKLSPADFYETLVFLINPAAYTCFREENYL